jgi:HK97 family phage portal protein
MADMKWPWSKPAPPQTRATDSQRVLAVTVQGQTIWALINYEDFVTNGYGKNPIVYRCIRLISEMASATPWMIDGKDLSDTPTQLAQTLLQPSDSMSQPDLIEAIVGSLMLAGEAFVEGMELRGELVEMAYMRPDYVKVVPATDGTVLRYEFETGGGRKLYPVPLPRGTGASAWGQVCHIKTWHPTDQWRGHSPMLAAASAIMEHNGVGDFARALLKNAARPSGALVYGPKDPTVPSTLSDEQFERLKRELNEDYSGVANAGRPMLLEGGLAWVPMSLTPMEMGTQEARATASREIALALGVPPLLLGLPGDNTYANYAEANIALWRQTVKPMLRRITGRLTRWLQPLYRGVLIEPDYDDAPIAEAERALAFERVQTSDFLTIDEKRIAVGYPELEGGLGNHVLVGASLTTLKDLIDTAGMEPAAAGEQAYGPEGQDDGED